MSALSAAVKKQWSLRNTGVQCGMDSGAKKDNAGGDTERILGVDITRRG